MKALPYNKLIPLSIAWQQDTTPTRIIPPISLKQKLKKTEKQENKAAETDLASQKLKEPEQLRGYMKAPRYEYF